MGEGKKRTSAKTLETAREAGVFAKKMLKSALTAQAEGRPTAWSMVTLWEGDAVLKAMGLEVVYPEDYGAFCAAVGAAEPYLERSYGEGFPSSLCGYARNALGYAALMAENNMQIPDNAPGGGMARPAVMVGSGVLCDARYKWFQALGRYLEIPVWVLELPHTGVREYYLPENKAHNIKMIVASLKEFVVFLEKLLDRKMDWDRLEQLVDRTYRTLKLAHQVDLLRRVTPSPMVAPDFWAVMIAHYYLPDDPEAFAFYQRVYDEVKHKVDNKIAAVANEKYRIIFAELPPWHSLGFFDEIARKYEIATVIESWSYHAPCPLPEEEIDSVTDPLERIARLCYHKMTEFNDTAMKTGVEPGFFMAAYPQWAADYRADGLLGHSLMSCRPATYTLQHIGQVLMDKLKVPSIIIDGDIVDLRVFNQDEALAKIEAFVETMDYYRDFRSQKGMPW